MKIFSRQTVFWLLFLLVLSLSGYGAYRLLAAEIFGYTLWNKLIQDPDHRWKAHERPDINSDGLRSYEEADAFHPEDFNIIFAGDSFTFGHLLSAEQSMPSRFQELVDASSARPRIHVVNFGWSSSSPYLSLRLLQDKGAKYKPDLVILLLDATDYKDDFFYRGVIEKRDAFKFIVEHPLLSYYPRHLSGLTDSWTHWHEKWLGYPSYSNYFLFHQPLEKSRPFFDGTYEILLAMNEYVTRELGAKFVVFIPPRHWQYTDKESPKSWERHGYVALGPYVLNNFIYFEEKRSAAPFPLVPLLEDFKASPVFPTTFEKDSHWNPDGARLAAEIIYQHCQQIGCFKKNP